MHLEAILWYISWSRSVWKNSQNISSLQNLLYIMTIELTFENFYLDHIIVHKLELLGVERFGVELDRRNVHRVVEFDCLLHIDIRDMAHS